MYAAAAKAMDLPSTTLAEMNEALVEFEQSTRARFSKPSSRLETSLVTVIETERVLMVFVRALSGMALA